MRRWDIFNYVPQSQESLCSLADDTLSISYPYTFILTDKPLVE